MPNVSFKAPTEYEAELADIERSRAYAKALQEQGMSPLDTQMVGGWAIPRSPFEYLGKAAQQAAGAYGQKKATDKQKELAKRLRTEGQEDVTKFMGALQGTPAKPEITMPPEELGGGPGREALPAIPGDRQKALAIALQSQNPMVQGAGGSILSEMLKTKDPKWQVTERFNERTGKPEKVLIDMTNPQNVQPFGGQKAASVQIGPDGRAYDPTVTAPGTLFNDPNKLVAIGPDGKPMVNPAAMQARKEIAQAGKTQVNTTILPPQKTFENEDKLRADFTADPTVKASSEMDTAFRMIDAAYKRPSAANDLAMATKYMKILDPTSVVRESEFALAVNATGLLDKVQNYAASITEGKKLNPKQRKDFYDSAKAINDAFQGKRKEVESQYSEMATGYGLNPKNVIPSLRRSGGTAPAGVDKALWDAMTEQERALWRK